MPAYQVYKFDPPDHVVTTDESDQYWEDHLFTPIQTLANSMDPTDQLVITGRQQAIGIATVEANEVAVTLLQANGYTVVPVITATEQ